MNSWILTFGRVSRTIPSAIVISLAEQRWRKIHPAFACRAGSSKERLTYATRTSPTRRGSRPQHGARPRTGTDWPWPGCNLFPAPPSVAATVNLSLLRTSAVDVNRSLVGPVQLLNTGRSMVAKGTITIPLYLDI